MLPYVGCACGWLTVVFFCGCWLLVGLLAGLSNSVAADRVVGGAPVTITPHLGFSDTYKIGHWAPLSTVVTNRGAHIAGHVELVVSYGDSVQGDNHTITYRQRLELPGESRKRFRWTVFLDSFAKPLVVRVVSAGNAGAGQQIARREIDLRASFTESQLLLVLSRDADLDYLNQGLQRGNQGAQLGGAKALRPNEGGEGESEGSNPNPAPSAAVRLSSSVGSRRGLRVVYSHPEMLPNHWHGYDGVSALVVHGISLDNLTDRQFEALNRWLHQGGTLTVSGGPDYSLLRVGRLAQLLPGIPEGLTRFDDPQSVAQALKVELPGHRPFAVNRVVRYEGSVTARAGAVPLVIEQNIGRGRVVYLTFDIARYPFAGTASLEGLWNKWLRLSAGKITASYQKPEPPSGVLAAIRGAATGFPGHTTVLVFVVIYLGVLFTGYRLGARTERQRTELSTSSHPRSSSIAVHPSRPSPAHTLRPSPSTTPMLRDRTPAWLVPSMTWAAPLIFAPLAYVLFRGILFPTGTTAVMVSTIEALGESGFAHVKAEVGMYSNQRRDLPLHYAGIETLLRPAYWERRNQAVVNWIVSGPIQQSIRPAEPKEFALQLLEGQDVIPFGLRAEFTETKSGVSVVVRNDSGRQFRGMWLITDGFAYAVPGNAIGDVLEKRFERTTDGASIGDSRWRGSLWVAIESFKWERDTVSALLGRRFNDGRSVDPGLGRARIVALASNPMRPTGTAANWALRELALVVAEFPVSLIPRRPDEGVADSPFEFDSPTSAAQ